MRSPQAETRSRRGTGGHRHRGRAVGRPGRRAGAALALLAAGLAPSATGQQAARERPDLEIDADLELIRAMTTAADRGLEWLAARQSPHGYWLGDVGHKRGDGYVLLRSARDNDARGEGHVGVTALAGLAFLAGGHLPDRGPYGRTVRRTLDYIVEHVRENGIITDGGTRMYSHAFATLFLAEVHGMVGGDAPRVRTALERAVHLIVDCQNAQGGWRYNAFTHEADMSVTVCQLQALRAARNIGIRVPKRTIDDAVAYVLRARIHGGYLDGLYYYKTQGASARTKPRQFAINAAAVTALLSAGVHDQELHAPTLDFLEQSYDETVYMHGADHYMYWYGNYYAAQAFLHAGGERFLLWQRKVANDLLRSQRADGRWPNGVGPGDEFGTAVAVLLLQMPKQYLPIFQR